MTRTPDAIVELRRALGRLLASHREASKLTQSDLGRRTNYSRTSITHIEAGRQMPADENFWRLADDLLGAQGALVGQHARIQSAELKFENARRVEERDRIDRRITGGDRSRLGHDVRVDFALSHPGCTDYVAVAQIREQVHSLDCRYDKSPSTSLLAETGQRLGQIAFFQDHVSAGRILRELSLVEAEAAILMGQLVWDASQRRDHRAAKTYFKRAAVSARRIQAPSVEGLAFLRASFVALYGEKNPRVGLTLTQRSAECARHASPVVGGLAMLHAAEAHAMLLDRRECERALVEAERKLESIQPDDPAIQLYSPSQYGRLSGSCYLFLGDFDRAQGRLQATSKSLGDGSKSQAIVLGNLSLTYIRQRKIDEGVGSLHAAIDIIERTWGGGGMNVAFEAARELKPWRSVSLVQEVYDRLMDLMTA